MKRLLYLLGRGLQLLALLVLPSAIWVGWMGHDERGSITLFLGSIAVFYSGYFLTQWGTRL